MMTKSQTDSVISFKTDSETENESEIEALREYTQSHVNVNFSGGVDSASTFVDITWPVPSNEFIRIHAVNLKISTTCRICRQPGRPSELVFCTGCGAPKRPVHKKCLARDREHILGSARRTSGDGDQDCEEVEYVDYVFTRYLLRAPTPSLRPELHANDATCTWIGVPVLQKHDKPQIHVWSRLKDLLQMSQQAHQRQYPNLISFVGDTGSGKSTLIRTMIHMAQPENRQEASVPVPGLPEDRFVSTSSDIHAYADPLTLSTMSPMVYVDCEGFVGSDRPVSQEIVTALSEPGWLLECKYGTKFAEHSVHKYFQEKQDKLLKKVKQFLEGATNRINLEWGCLDSPDPRSPGARRTVDGRELCRVAHETRKRVVGSLYPRVLYGFSDLVCFVSTNGRSSDAFLGELIQWAQESHDRILNQQMKPALIIIINKELNMDLHGNTSSNPTEDLLRGFQNTERFERLQRFWKEREHPIEKTADLLRCYYSDFKVVLIPALTGKSSPAETVAVSQSIKRLYETIRASVAQVRRCKIQSCTESDLATLNTHLNRSLSILGQDDRNALDLHEIVTEDSPIPTKLSDHMASTLQKMCKYLKLDTTDEIGGEQALVDRFAPYVGACIVAQMGWIGDSDLETRRTTKERLVAEAQLGLQKFRLKHWRCEARDVQGKRRCQNYHDGHDKGHQFKSRADSTVETLIIKGDKSSDICDWKPKRIKPRDAGPRVLALDGGGVRGVVELYVLREIEKHVGYGISIHELFDLVVGTSTEDYFSREDEQFNDFKVWEAARATSAAPAFFQPFVHKKTQRSYEDGALVYNNPVSLAFSEVDKIWPESLPPDIVLSIGTGLVIEPTTGKVVMKRNSTLEGLKKLLPGGLRKQIEAGLGIIQASMSCHEAWREFKRVSVPEPRVRDNCHRVNVGLTQRVEIDDVGKMDVLLQDCERYLSDDTSVRYYNKGYRTAAQHVRAVSKRLLASLFYYVGPLQDTMAGGKWEGHIFCRLEPGSASAAELLRDHIQFRLAQIPHSSMDTVYSRISPHPVSGSFNLRDLSAHVVLRVAEGTYERYIEVNVPQWEGAWEPISGF
ncbi:hypothetical protein F53441_8031 [Fusarium austroafricanum]|uniref:PNPLA domain-containing protein n=1 Tax=Fusarium austroafricanum TaxID=2364996 RepID=A0A8H4KG84_9HYPO|nr:hypothetical protein F53441_8031 [Fusarium austroafricanum]